MIGQSKLLSILCSTDYKSLPASILLIAKNGMGKHTLVKEVSNHYNIPLLDITNNLNMEQIIEISTSSIDRIYLIDISKITEKEQNVILKFVEEPTPTTHIFLLAESEDFVLDTIKNRCIKYYLEAYTKEELSQFVVQKESQEEILSVCKTPFQVQNINADTISNMKSTCEKMLTSLSEKTIYLYNALDIVDKVNFKDDYDKYDLDIFINIMLAFFSKNYTLYNKERAFKFIKVISKYRDYLLNTNKFNKQYLFERMIIEMWED